MDIDPFSMLEVSLQEEPDPNCMRVVNNPSANVRHLVENDYQMTQPPPFNHFQRKVGINPPIAVLTNAQKLIVVSPEEEKYRMKTFPNISIVLQRRLHCTICDAHIGAHIGLQDLDIEHPLLKVLACTKCTTKYHYLEFPLSPEGRDIRCRWCTNISKQESPLRFCSFCPFAFCELCIYRNLPLDQLASDKSNWICFVCNMKDLWPCRATLWALRVIVTSNAKIAQQTEQLKGNSAITLNHKWRSDQSTCCKDRMNRLKRMAISSQLTRINSSTTFKVVQPDTRPKIEATITPPQGLLRNKSPALYSQLTAKPAPPPPVKPMMVANRARTAPDGQLYDTLWLKEKVKNISNVILNLNTNLNKLAQGLRASDNKFSIKSKMISMVSLMNISSTQLLKVSRELEDESKKRWDNKKCFPTADSRPGPQKFPNKNSNFAKRSAVETLNNNNKRGRFEDDAVELSSSSEDDEDVVINSILTTNCFVRLERIDLNGLDESEEEEESIEATPSTSGELVKVEAETPTTEGPPNESSGMEVAQEMTSETSEVTNETSEVTNETSEVTNEVEPIPTAPLDNVVNDVPDEVANETVGLAETETSEGAFKEAEAEDSASEGALKEAEAEDSASEGALKEAEAEDSASEGALKETEAEDPEEIPTEPPTETVEETNEVPMEEAPSEVQQEQTGLSTETSEEAPNETTTSREETESSEDDDSSNDSSSTSSPNDTDDAPVEQVSPALEPQDNNSTSLVENGDQSIKRRKSRDSNNELDSTGAEIPPATSPVSALPAV